MSTNMWLLIAGMLIGVLLAVTGGQWLKIARLQGRIQSIGSQLKYLPKRKTDLVTEAFERRK
jgi:hypothetical protein